MAELSVTLAMVLLFMGLATGLAGALAGGRTPAGVAGRAADLLGWTSCLVALAAWLEVDRQDWALLLLTIALVWTAEALNSGLEYLADAAVPDHHHLIARAKDVAAAGVLVCAVVAVVVGILVFLPYL